MKLEALIFSIILVGMSPTLAQETNNYFEKESDNNFLKNYKAPDFKLSALTFVFDGNGRGTTTELNNNHFIQGGLNLYFSRYNNSSISQRGTSAAFETDFALANDNADVDYAISLRGYHNSQNRFYFQNSWFYGTHNQTDYRFVAVENNNDVMLTLKPAFSIGHGRIEPVGYARKAMDVERLLINGARFNSNFSEVNRKDLADKIARIENKRFFDPRLGRIYQMQALDSILQKMGVITENDMTYFSLLQDAFLYSNYQSRASGIRHELGITQGISLLPNAADRYMSFGFYKFSYYLPKNYVVQHNFTASIIGGLRADNSALTTNAYPLWLDANYDLGFYPTTRSFLSIGLNAGGNLDNNLGFVVGTDVQAYYYISPRFRFSFVGLFRFGENYTNHDFNIAVTNFTRDVKQSSYQFRFGLTYSIF